MSTRGFTIGPPAAGEPDASPLPGEPSPGPPVAHPIGCDDCIGGLSADECDEAAESPLQGEIIRAILSALEGLALHKRWDWAAYYLGGDAYFCWEKASPRMRVSPDVYLLDYRIDPLPASWEMWSPGHRPPRWALKVVSRRWTEDYQLAPVRYGALGCKELTILDPEVVLGGTHSRSRAALTLFRFADGGPMTLCYSGPGPALSEQLGCWIHVARHGYLPTLRFCEDEAGRLPIATKEELAQARIETAEAAARLAEEARARDAEEARDREAARARDAEEARARLEERLRQLETRKSGPRAPKGRRR